MELRDQVCSLENAKKLKELGIKQESLFSYNKQKFGSYILGNHPFYFNDGDEYSSTFTASELFELLPLHVITKENEPFNNFKFNLSRFYYVPETTPVKAFIVNYECDTTEVGGLDAWLKRKLFDHGIFDENLADCLAKLLIRLIEEGFIKI